MREEERREREKRLKGYSNNGLQLIMFMHTRANPLAGRQYGLTHKLTHTNTDRHTHTHWQTYVDQRAGNQELRSQLFNEPKTIIASRKAAD